MGKYFKISDLEVTETGISNTMSEDDKKDAIWFIDTILDPIRTELGLPIKINSGYRCSAVNLRVKGATNSDHRSIGKIFACDLTTGNKVDNKKLYDVILKMQKLGKISFKQLINEYGFSWIHISSYTLDAVINNKNQILKIG